MWFKGGYEYRIDDLAEVSWQERVTASIDGTEGRTIIAEGALGEVVAHLSAAYPSPQHRRILLAFPDRLAPPYRIDGAQISRLADEYQRQHWAALWQTVLVSKTRA